MVPVVHILKPDLQDHQLYGAEEVSIPSGGGQDLSRGGPEMVHFEVQDHDLTGYVQVEMYCWTYFDPI